MFTDVYHEGKKGNNTVQHCVSVLCRQIVLQCSVTRVGPTEENFVRAPPAPSKTMGLSKLPPTKSTSMAAGADTLGGRTCPLDITTGSISPCSACDQCTCPVVGESYGNRNVMGENLR